MTLEGPWLSSNATYFVELSLGSRYDWRVNAGVQSVSPFIDWTTASLSDSQLAIYLAEANGTGGSTTRSDAVLGFPGDDNPFTWDFVQIILLPPDGSGGGGYRVNPAVRDNHAQFQVYSQIASITSIGRTTPIVAPTLPPDAVAYQWESSFGTLIGNVELFDGVWSSSGLSGASAMQGALYVSTHSMSSFHTVSEITGGDPFFQVTTVPSNTALVSAPTVNCGPASDIFGGDTQAEQASKDFYLYTLSNFVRNPGSEIWTNKTSGLYTWETKTYGMKVRVKCRMPRYRFLYEEPVTGANLHPLRQRQFLW